jgi:hypothetical protein
LIVRARLDIYRISIRSSLKKGHGNLAVEMKKQPLAGQSPDCVQLVNNTVNPLPWSVGQASELLGVIRIRKGKRLPSVSTVGMSYAGM